MRKPTLVPTDVTANPVYLTAAAISSLIQTLPSGTAYCIGIVLMVMMTGRLMQHKCVFRAIVIADSNRL